MTRCTIGFLTLALVVLGCSKKDEDPETVPTPVASAPATTVTSTPPDADAGAAAGVDGGAAVTAAPPPATAPVAAKPASIDACCAAITAITKSGRGATARGAAGRAAQICPGIAARVKTGEVSRSAGLNLVKGSLAGVTIPSECH